MQTDPQRRHTPRLSQVQAEGSIEEISALLSAHLPLFAASVHVEARMPKQTPRYNSARAPRRQP